jgi:hypothetical protein
MRKLIWMSLALTVACGGDKGEDTSGPGGGDGDGDADGGGGGGVFEDFINVTDAPVGNLDCFTGTLGTETAGSGCLATRTMSATVMDFQDDIPVDEATVELYLADGIFGAADETNIADSNGMFSVEMPTCQPFTTKVYTDPVLDATRVTIEAHDVLPFSSIPTVSHELNSVSSATYGLIPTFLGTSPDESKGIIAGVAYDCEGGNLEGLQVLVEDVDGDIPEGAIAKYFVDEFPSRGQAYTSADGIFIIMDVPEGKWVVTGYVADGMGGHSMVARTELSVFAKSINISSLYVGISDGVKMPETCLSGC